MNKLDLTLYHNLSPYEFRGLLLKRDKIHKRQYQVLRKIIEADRADIILYGYKELEESHYKIWVKYRYGKGSEVLKIDNNELSLDKINNFKTKIGNYSVKLIDKKSISKHCENALETFLMSDREFLKDSRFLAYEKNN